MIAATDPAQPGWPVNPGRSRGYDEALAGAGLPQDPDLVVTVPWGGVSGADAMARLLSLREPPTAVYAHSDEIAFGAIRTLQRAGLRVPEDMSIVGIDDHPVAELADLTTVAQPVHAQGVRAGHLVLSLLANESPAAGVTLPTRLMIRNSTAPPRNARSGEKRRGGAHQRRLP
jgi:DNA-binding LacI/PurR family transcriptional regulator